MAEGEGTTMVPKDQASEPSLVVRELRMRAFARQVESAQRHNAQRRAELMGDTLQTFEIIDEWLREGRYE